MKELHLKTTFSPWKFYYFFVVSLSQRRKWQPTPVFLPGETHGQRIMVDYSPQGRKELGMTEQLHFHFSLSCIGDQCMKWQPTPVFLPGESQGRRGLVGCLYGVAQSRTRLKRLSSSSSSSIIQRSSSEKALTTHSRTFA